jgi:hypothetical protein
MKDRITIEGRDGALALISRDRRLCRLPPSSFCMRCSG